MKLLTVLFVALVVLFSAPPINALEDPLQSPNNHFGIHVIDINDFKQASELVNSNSGEWGYITFVIREDDRNFDKWQQAFDQLRELKLIPLVRLATKSQGDTWDAPRSDDISPWVNFLNSLNWVTKNRYIIKGWSRN